MKPLFLLALLSLAGCEVQFSDPNACRCAKPQAPLRLETTWPNYNDLQHPKAIKAGDGGLWVSVQRADGQGLKEVYVGPTQIVGDVIREAESAVPATGGGYWAKVPGDSPWATEFELGFELGTLGASAEQAKAMIKQFRAGQTHDIKFWVQSKTGHYPK